MSLWNLQPGAFRQKNNILKDTVHFILQQFAINFCTFILKSHERLLRCPWTNCRHIFNTKPSICASWDQSKCDSHQSILVCTGVRTGGRQAVNPLSGSAQFLLHCPVVKIALLRGHRRTAALFITSFKLGFETRYNHLFYWHQALLCVCASVAARYLATRLSFQSTWRPP